MCPLNWWYRRWSNLAKWPRHSATWWFYVRLTSQQIFSDCIYRFKCVRLHDSLCRYLGNICIAKQLQYELMPVRHLRAIVKTGQEEYITDIGRMNEALQEAGCAFITLIQAYLLQACCLVSAGRSVCKAGKCSCFSHGKALKPCYLRSALLLLLGSHLANYLVNKPWR